MYLQHHGVLGMKWGVRKQRRQTVKQAKKDAGQLAQLKKSNRINASYEKRALQKQVDARKSDKAYNKAFNDALRDIEAKVEAKKLKVKNTVALANTIATVYSNPMSLYKEDPITKKFRMTMETAQERQRREDPSV